MTTLRTLYHLARADFLERVRRSSKRSEHRVEGAESYAPPRAVTAPASTSSTERRVVFCDGGNPPKPRRSRLVVEEDAHGSADFAGVVVV